MAMMMQAVSLVGELGDDSVELLEVDVLVGFGPVVNRSAVQQLPQVVVVDRVVDLLGNALELLELDRPVPVGVEKGEHTLEAVLGLGLAHTGGDGVEELLEADGFVLLLEAVDEVEDEGVSPVETQLLEHLVDLNGVDGSAAVLIEHLEGSLEVLVVLGEESVLPGGGYLHGGGGSFGLSSAHGSHLNNKNQYIILSALSISSAAITLPPNLKITITDSEGQRGRPVLV